MRPSNWRERKHKNRAQRADNLGEQRRDAANADLQQRIKRQHDQHRSGDRKRGALPDRIDAAEPAVPECDACCQHDDREIAHAR